MCDSKRQTRFVRQVKLRGAVIGGTFKRPSRATLVLYFCCPTDNDNPANRKAIPKRKPTKTPSTTTATVADVVPSGQYPLETSPINGNAGERCVLSVETPTDRVITRRHFCFPRDLTRAAELPRSQDRSREAGGSHPRFLSHQRRCLLQGKALAGPTAPKNRTRDLRGAKESSLR